ncbi:MAG: NADH-quinone oxidoreductase subunit C [Propionibacteriaceae bacterium]|jgi:NADH-quinone oxidoreductase subunit C|nr:NADH-quinone oxidoreductase subunit C [Propionibacteriaceae bacterium]
MTAINPAGGDEQAVAKPEPTTPIAFRQGMWSAGPSDVSGYGGLVQPIIRHVRSAAPYGGWFDQVAERLRHLVPDLPVDFVGIDRAEMTAYIPRQLLLAVVQATRDDPALRFEICLSVAGVHYPDEAGSELHAVYELLSITHNRRLRLEVTAPDDDPQIPSVTSVYPMVNWHERETWDMFGLIFTGHPGLTRILMPDDWVGHPQRKDYPLNGVPVEFKGAKVPPPDQRRSYQ